MTSTFGILRRNIAIFPGLAKLAALEALMFAVFVSAVAAAGGATIGRAALISLVAVLAAMAADLVLFEVVRRRPALYARAQRVADAVYGAMTEDHGPDDEDYQVAYLGPEESEESESDGDCTP